MIESSAGAAGLGAFPAEVGGDDFDGAAHFEEAGAHAAADALVEGIFAGGHDEFSAGEAGSFAFSGGIVVGVEFRGDDCGAAFVVAGVQNDADDVADPHSEGLLAPRSSRSKKFFRPDGFEDAHFGGFAGGIVASLNFF